MKQQLRLSNRIVLTSIALITLLSLSCVASLYAQPVPIGRTAQPAPYESRPKAHTLTGVSPDVPTFAYDGDLSSGATFSYGVTGSFELNTFNTSNTQFTNIGWVDFKISYQAQGVLNNDDKYRIVYYVSTSGPVVLQDWVNGTNALFANDGLQAHRVWANQAKPGGGSWTWTDIGNVRVRFETQLVGTSDSKTITAYEVWVTVYPDTISLPTAGLSVLPGNLTSINFNKKFFVDIYAANAQKWWSFSLTLTYNTFVLTALDYFSYDPFNLDRPPRAEINDRTGYVILNYHSFGGDTAGFTGREPVARIYFQVDGTGQSWLNLTNTQVSNVTGSSISHTVANGYFRNVASASIPKASFTYTPSNPSDGQTITFDASTSNGGNGSISKYRWDFGDDVKLTPNGNGLYTGWTGDVRDWDDPLDVSNDGDTTGVTATAGALNQSSTLQKPSNIASLRAHTINKVTLTAIARYSLLPGQSSSDEKMILMLVTGGKGYWTGTGTALTTDYSTYTSEWTTNPKTLAAWQWSDIDTLQAGARSVMVGSWTANLMVTQLYVTVSKTIVDITASSSVTYFYAYRGEYTVNLGVYNNYGIVGQKQTKITVKGHDVALTSVTPYGYEALTPQADGTYQYWNGNYTQWDDWPNPDYNATKVVSRPNVILTPNGHGTFTQWRSWVYINPKGDGLYTAWTGTYTQWDDWPSSDGDTTYVSAAAANINETSTLTTPPLPPRTLPIFKVRVTMLAKVNVTAANDRVRIMLVVGGKGYYNSTLYTLTTAYSTKTAEWPTNPATGNPWQWSEIDTLQAGVRSEQSGGSFAGEIRVTQLYVSILTSGLYTNWNEFPDHDVDATTVFADVNVGDNKNQTSTMKDPTPNMNWAIDRIRVTYYAKNTVASSDERIEPILVLGGKMARGVSTSLTTSYPSPVPYYYEWTTNPFWPGHAWNWTAITSLEVGFRSVQTASWTGELRVTQMFLTVIADKQTSKLVKDTLVIKPNGAGAFSQWYGSYTDWDDWPTYDGDTTKVYANSTTGSGKRQSSALEDHSTQNWGIGRIALTAVARDTATLANESFRLMLVIGGVSYYSSDQYYLGTSYGIYRYEWTTNPATGNPWQWSEIDALQAGVSSNLDAGLTWSGEIRVTQLFVTVSPLTESFDIANVKMTVVCRSNMTTDDEIRMIMIIGGSVFYPREIKANTTYAAYSMSYDLNPLTSNYWSWADIATLEAGTALWQVGPDWTGEFWVTQIYVEVIGLMPPGTNAPTIGDPQIWGVIKVTPQETVKFLVPVVNQGNYNESNVVVTLYSDATSIGAKTIYRLANSTYVGNSTITLEFTWLVDGMLDGTHSISARTNTITGENDTADNTVGTHAYLGLTRNAQVNVGLYHDVAVTAVGGRPTPAGPALARAYKGVNIKVYVTVKNQGSRSETFTVTAYYNASVLGTPQGVTMAPGEERVLNFTWNTASLSYAFYVISASASSVAGETDLADNTKALGTVMLTIPGDANGDHKVNSLDLGTLNGHWAPASGTPGWSLGYDQNVDVNNDGYINSLDMGVVNGHWGQSW